VFGAKRLSVVRFEKLNNEPKINPQRGVNNQVFPVIACAKSVNYANALSVVAPFPLLPYVKTAITQSVVIPNPAEGG
jgi:hypothetical protein